ncbi:hypothetical protein MBLNU13_g05232t1 [Cladosporium sp. NU13]
MNFITSPFGSIAAAAFATDTPATATRKIPRLRFEQGDLVIKLGHEPSRWLIIHSKVFAAVSPVFRASTSEAWKETAQLDAIKHPRTGKDVEVRTLALKRVDDTYILECKDVTLQAEDASTISAVPFHQSSLATEDWPALTGHNTPLANDEESTTLDPSESAHALHVYFALVYGAQLTLPQIAGEKHLTRRFLDVCAYADYYGCFDTFKPLLARAIRLEGNGGKNPIYRDVAHNPLVYAFVARIFRLEPLYNDALRQLVATAYLADLAEPNTGDWAAIAELMDLDEEEVLNLFPWQLSWIGEPGALPPKDRAKLEGKGWNEMGMPVAAQYTESAYFKAHTHLAMPMARLPWKKGRRAKVVEWERVDWKEVVKGVSVEETSEEWFGEIVKVLGE